LRDGLAQRPRVRECHAHQQPFAVLRARIALDGAELVAVPPIEREGEREAEAPLALGVVGSHGRSVPHCNKKNEVTP
jgi:hypothetical protein